jgi:hypothetical protein
VLGVLAFVKRLPRNALELWLAAESVGEVSRHLVKNKGSMPEAKVIFKAAGRLNGMISVLKDAAATATELNLVDQEEKMTFAIETLDHVEHILVMVQKYANVFEGGSLAAVASRLMKTGASAAMNAMGRQLYNEVS